MSEKAPKVITSHAFSGLKFPGTGEGWKDLMGGKDYLDSYSRTIVSLGLTAAPILPMTAFNVSPEKAPELAYFAFLNLAVAAGQTVIGVRRANSQATDLIKKREKDRKAVVKEQKERLTNRLNPIVAELTQEHQVNNPIGVTPLNLYTGNPLPGTDVIEIGLYLKSKAGFTTNEVVLKLTEQREIKLEYGESFDASYEATEVNFWFERSFSDKLVYRGGETEGHLSKLKLANQALSSLEAIQPPQS